MCLKHLSGEEGLRFEIACVLRISILPSNERYFEFYKRRTFSIFLIVIKFFRIWVYFKKIYISTVKSINFNPQTVSVTPFRKAMSAISHLLMFSFKFENCEKVWRISIIECRVICICCKQKAMIKNFNTFN